MRLLVRLRFNYLSYAPYGGPYTIGHLRHGSSGSAGSAVAPYYPHHFGAGIKEDRYITLRLNELHYTIRSTDHENAIKDKK